MADTSNWPYWEQIKDHPIANWISEYDASLNVYYILDPNNPNQADQVTPDLILEAINDDINDSSYWSGKPVKLADGMHNSNDLPGYEKISDANVQITGYDYSQQVYLVDDDPSRDPTSNNYLAISKEVTPSDLVGYHNDLYSNYEFDPEQARRHWMLNMSASLKDRGVFGAQIKALKEAPYKDMESRFHSQVLSDMYRAYVYILNEQGQSQQEMLSWLDFQETFADYNTTQLSTAAGQMAEPLRDMALSNTFSSSPFAIKPSESSFFPGMDVSFADRIFNSLTTLDPDPSRAYKQLMETLGYDLGTAWVPGVSLDADMLNVSHNLESYSQFGTQEQLDLAREHARVWQTTAEEEHSKLESLSGIVGEIRGLSIFDLSTDEVANAYQGVYDTAKAEYDKNEQLYASMAAYEKVYHDEKFRESLHLSPEAEFLINAGSLAASFLMPETIPVSWLGKLLWAAGNGLQAADKALMARNAVLGDPLAILFLMGDMGSLVGGKLGHVELPETIADDMANGILVSSRNLQLADGVQLVADTELSPFYSTFYSKFVKLTDGPELEKDMAKQLLLQYAQGDAVLFAQINEQWKSSCAVLCLSYATGGSSAEDIKEFFLSMDEALAQEGLSPWLGRGTGLFDPEVAAVAKQKGYDATLLYHYPYSTEPITTILDNQYKGSFSGSLDHSKDFLWNTVVNQEAGDYVGLPVAARRIVFEVPEGAPAGSLPQPTMKYQGHMVLVEAATRYDFGEGTERALVIMDPNVGRIMVPYDEIQESWKARALTNEYGSTSVILINHP